MLRVPLLRRQPSSTFRSFSTILPSNKELYEQTDFRWLFNEAEREFFHRDDTQVITATGYFTEQKIRHVNFNVSELINVASAATCAGPCLFMQKIAEGSFNKIFRLKFNNSHSVIARIPSSHMFKSGVSHVVASEVATMTAVGDNLNVRTPQVIAWNKESDITKNPVGWPYILMEDIDGVSLNHEWATPEMRGEPVGKLLTNVLNDMHRMTFIPFTRLGSLYFPEDLPSVPSSSAPSFLEEQVRVGPISDYQWWRAYHDELDMDRGPWDTLEDCIKAAVRLERRAVERHREDPSSLSCTNSSVNDLTEVERLLDKVEALAPRLQTAFETSSHFPEEFMRNVLIHPDIRSHNLMVPKLSANKENSVTRMNNPVFIDWQGTCVLPWALQFSIPPLVEYQAGLFRQDGQPLFKVNGFEEVPFPKEFDSLNSEEQEAIRAEHRFAMRHFRWVEGLLSRELYADVVMMPIQYYFHRLIQAVLRACADGPYSLQLVLMSIKKLWDKEPETFGGPCPYTFEADELRKYEERCEKSDRFDTALQLLLVRLNCGRDGAVPPEDYERCMKDLTLARKEWDEEACGGPFPFEDGRWGPYLR